MEKILTVSIAAYNVEKYIQETLMPFDNEKIIEALEVLVIDDGGIDSTLEIAKQYSDKYPDSVKLVHKENGGWGSTVNTGIEMATGKYFKQLDGDDYFLRSTLQQYIELLQEIDCDLIYTPFATFRDGDGKVIERNGSISDYELMRVYSVDEIAQEIPLNMHSCTFRTQLLKNDVQILENCFYTDVEYIIKGISNIKTVLFSDIEVYQYRVARTGQSMSIEGFRKHFEEHQRVLFTLLDYVQNVMVTPVLNAMFKHRLKDMVTMQYIIYLYLEPNMKNKKKLVMYDNKIKSSYPEYYPTDAVRVKILRKTRFLGYRLIANNTVKSLNM